MGEECRHGTEVAVLPAEVEQDCTNAVRLSSHFRLCSCLGNTHAIPSASHQLPGAKLDRLVENTAPGEGRDSLGLKQSNFTRWSGCVGQSSISGQQCASEPFGQGNIRRVVGGDVGSELVGPSE